jgi:hypothetical protein
MVQRPAEPAHPFARTSPAAVTPEARPTIRIEIDLAKPFLEERSGLLVCQHSVPVSINPVLAETLQ